MEGGTTHRKVHRYKVYGYLRKNGGWVECERIRSKTKTRRINESMLTAQGSVYYAVDSHRAAFLFPAIAILYGSCLAFRPTKSL